MRAEIVFIAGLLVCIALTLSACTPQKIAELDEHAKEVVVTFTTPQPEPPKMIETFTAAEITEIVNPYFSVQNSTSEIFRVDHAGNFYLYPLTNCDTLDTDANGLLSCGTDANTQLSEDNVEAYIFDADNTANLDMNNYNVTVNTIIMEVDQANHWIYDNATCIVIKAGTTYLEVCE